jgi:hypothetical protein
LSKIGDWDWLIAGYYNDTVKPPKRPGALALEVGVKGEAAKQMEIAVFEGREDIGDIVVRKNE